MQTPRPFAVMQNGTLLFINHCSEQQTARSHIPCLGHDHRSPRLAEGKPMIPDTRAAFRRWPASLRCKKIHPLGHGEGSDEFAVELMLKQQAKCERPLQPVVLNKFCRVHHINPQRLKGSAIAGMQKTVRTGTFALIDCAEHIVAVRKVRANAQAVAPFSNDWTHIAPDFLASI